jgi:hypothetical protein
VRRLANVLPGALPVAVNGVRVAASIRPKKFVIQGGDDTPVVMPRVAFQVVYPDCTVMIDSGLDRFTHESFGGSEPYYPDEFANLERALAGLVLIKSPGHSPDSQMVFIRLQSGRDILHSVDSAWTMENIRQVKGKAAPWVKEDVPAILGQLRWLRHVDETERNLTILVTHDNKRFDALTRAGTIGTQLAL